MSDVGAPVRRQGPPAPSTIMDASHPARRASTLPAPDVPDVAVPARFARTRPLGLRELARVNARAALAMLRFDAEQIGRAHV